MSSDGKVIIGTEIDQSGANKGLGKLRTNVKKFGSSIGKATTTALKGTAVAITAVGTAIIGASTTAIKFGSDFEAQMSRVKAISGATAEEFTLLSEKAKEMGIKTKFSATESAKAMEYMAMAGWKTEDMLQGIEGIMNLAAASGEDLAITSDIVTDALTAFGLQASDSAHFADVLASASTNANTNVSMMGETFKYVAPVAGALKYSAEDVAVAIGLMANSSIKGSQAGTSLRSIMTRLAKPTDEVAVAMETLGISLTDSDGKVKSFDKVIQNLRSSFADLSETEKTQMAASLAGQEAMSGLLAIVNASDEDFDKLTKAINNSEGAAQKMAETMQNNLQGQLTILKSSAEGLGIELYESMQKPLTNIAKIGVESLNTLTETFKKQGATGLANAIGDILAQAVTGISSQAPNLIDLAVKVIQSFVKGLQDNAPQVAQASATIFSSLVKGIIQLLPTVLSLAVTIQKEWFNAISKQLPKIAKTGYKMLEKFVNGFVKGVPTMLPKILDFIQGIGDKITEVAPILVQKGFELLSKLADGIVTAIPILIAKVPTIISTFANVINDNFPTIIMKGVQLIGKLIVGILQAIPTLIANVPKIISAIVDVWSAFNWLNLGKNAITFLKDGVLSMLGAVKGAGTSIFNAIKNPITNLPSTLANLGKSAMYSLGNTISGMVSFVKTGALKIVSGIETTIRTLPGKMISIGKNIVRGLWNGISDMTGWVINKIQGFGDSVLSGIKDFFEIHSPSKVMEREVGQWLAKGIGVGFEKYNPMIQIQKSLDVGMRGLESSLFGGVTNNNNQTNNFYGVQTPDQISRSLRMQQLYGLAGAR